MHMRRRSVYILAVLSVAAVLPGCGPGGATTGCAEQSDEEAIASAEVAIEGVVAEGPSRRIGDRQMALSPATIEVLRYIKGDGPRTIAVDTAFGNDPLGGEAIEPALGERWLIVGQADGGTIKTSYCAGSRPLAEPYGG